jgi:hypothetical protein
MCNARRLTPDARRLTPDGDAKTDLLPGVADGFNRDGVASNDDDADQTTQFVPLVLEIKAPIRLSTAKVKFVHPGVSPSLAFKDGQAPEYEYKVGDAGDTGAMRLWTRQGHQARNKEPVTTQGGEYVPPGEWIPAATLGFTTTRTKTFYVEGLHPCQQVSGARIEVQVDAAGDGALGVGKYAVRTTIIKIDLIAVTSLKATEENPGTPIALNDDWDCDQTYEWSTDEHYDREPIWDKDYLGFAPDENDLVKVTLTLSPAGLPGNVRLKAVSGQDKFRLWDQPTKGSAEHLIDATGNGKSVPTGDLPLEAYAEGVALGRGGLQAQYEYKGLGFADTLNIDVFRLQEHQEGVARFINEYNKDIDFDVQGDSQDAMRYTYRWDLDGNSSYGDGEWEDNEVRLECVKYGPGANASGNIQLLENQTNNTKEYAISVCLKACAFKGGLVLRKTMKVALSSFQGTALPPQSTDGLHTMFTWSNTYSITFYDFDPDQPDTEGAKRIKYKPTITGGHVAGTIIGPSTWGASTQIWCVQVSSLCWSEGYTREILRAIIAHEIIHLEQYAEARDVESSLWRALHDQWQDAITCAPFMEAAAYRSYLANREIDWRFVRGHALHFAHSYGLAKYKLGDLSGDLLEEAKAFLRTEYHWLTEDMKRPGYDVYVRPPY